MIKFIGKIIFYKIDLNLSLSFSPMNRCERLQFHNLCNCYALRTKSFGSGSQRFPSVYKTQVTTLIPMATIASTLEFLAVSTIETLKQHLLSPNPFGPSHIKLVSGKIGFDFYLICYKSKF